MKDFLILKIQSRLLVLIRNIDTLKYYETTNLKYEIQDLGKLKLMQ